MLPLFVLASIIGLATLSYLWPSANDTRPFKLSFLTIFAATFFLAVGEILSAIGASGGTWILYNFIPCNVICQTISWFFVLLGLKGIFKVLNLTERFRS